MENKSGGADGGALGGFGIDVIENAILRPDTAERTKESVRPALLLENILDEAIDFDPVKGDYYFLQDLVGDNGVMSTAATLLFANLQNDLSPEAMLDDIVAERLSLSAQQRMLLLSGNDIILRTNENENGKFDFNIDGVPHVS